MQLEKKRLYAKTRVEKKNAEKDKARMAKIKELDVSESSAEERRSGIAQRSHSTQRS